MIKFIKTKATKKDNCLFFLIKRYVCNYKQEKLMAIFNTLFIYYLSKYFYITENLFFIWTDIILDYSSLIRLGYY